MLEQAYRLLILLRDCIVRAVDDKDFYVLLITVVISADPDPLQKQLHQCIHQCEFKPQHISLSFFKDMSRGQ